MPSQRDWRILLTGLVIADVLCLSLALGGASWLASHPPLGQGTKGVPAAISALLVALLIAVFITQGLYDPHNLLGGTREYAAVFQACSYGVILLLLIAFAANGQVSREWAALSWALALGMVGWTRFGVRRIAYSLRRRGHFTTRAIIVGADADAVAVAEQLTAGGSGVTVVGFLDDYVHAGSVVLSDLRVLGRPAALQQIAARTKATEAVVVPQALPWETLRDLMAQTAAVPNGLRVHLSAGFYDLLRTSVRLSEHNHVPLLTVRKARLTRAESLFKRTLDIGLSSALLILFGPILIGAALWSVVHGERVLERRRIMGQDGRRFNQLSFASSARGRWHFIGKLPGLLNVLRGQLSMVGPRPIGEDEARTVSATPTRSLRPGLTGPWRRASEPGEQALLDLYYIRGYSVWLDLQVLFGRLLIRVRRGPAAVASAVRPHHTSDARA